MNRIFLSILLTLGVLTNSCISEKISEVALTPNPDPNPNPTPDPNPDEATRKTFHFRFLPDANIDSTFVNTYVGPYLGGLTPVLNWSTSESTGVFLTGSNGALLLSNNKYEFTPSVSIIYTESITTSLTSASAYGYTPYQASVSGTIVPYTLSNVQDQSADNSTEYIMDPVLERNVFTISPNSASFNLNGDMVPLTYKSIFAFLRFQIKKTDDIFSHERVRSVKLYIADDNDPDFVPVNRYALAGSYTIDVSRAPGTSGYSGPVFDQNSSYSVITSNVTGGGIISDTYESPYVWFVINPIGRIRSSERLISIVETTSGYKIVSKHDIPELTPNSIYTFTIEANRNGNTNLNQIQEISEERSSNCYTVHSPGIYRMYMRRPGEDVSLTGENVDWLWASKEGGNSSFDIKELIDTASIRYNKASGYVDFRIGKELSRQHTKGNVILALKDASDNIVWTWHIWITDKPDSIKYSDGKMFLDRNLGALSANFVGSGIDSYGFVYQWGRKDPFFGGNGLVNEKNGSGVFSIAANNTIVNNRARGGIWGGDDVAEWSETDAVFGSLEMAAMYPMKFFYSNSRSSSVVEPADWLTTSKQDLWSDDEKTIYDPCPPGYKVPSRDYMELLIAAKEAQDYNLRFENMGNRYWNYSYLLKNYPWPAAGMRQGRSSTNGNDGGQLVFSGTEGIEDYFGQCLYWTSTPAVLDRVAPGGSYRFKTSGYEVYSIDDFGDNADAYPIRCVKYTPAP